MKTVNTSDSLPITTNSLRIEAYAKLRRLILTGTIQPGDRIVETEMARMFGTSQAPIREALAKLEEDGLVCRQPYRGTYATEIVPKELYHTFRLRTQIECNGLELTAGRLTHDQIDELAEVVQEMEGAVGDSPIRYFREAELDMKFHALLLNWAGIDVYDRAWRSLESQVQRFLNLVHPTFFAKRRDHVVTQHRELIQVLQQPDVEIVQSRMRHHIMMIWDTLGSELLNYDRLDPAQVPSVDFPEN